MSLTPGQVLNNRYRIVKLFRSGGFGSVYRAWDMNFNISCAVKENLDLTPEVQRQFAREALILRNLHHPNLPQVVDYFLVPDQGQYLVMDFVEGKDLQDLIDDAGGPLPEAQVIPWIIQVCDALDCQHSQNPPIIHRDIKPANIKITPQGKAMLVDFGIAKYFDPNLPTTTGARAVTHGFSPPEQYGTGTTDARSDIYALGATLYTALTGQKPTESVQRSVGAPLPTPRALNRSISPQVEAAILKALDIAQSKRYQSVVELKTALVALPPSIARTLPQTTTQPVIAPQPFVRTRPATVHRPLPRWAVPGALLSVFLILILIFGWNLLSTNQARQYTTQTAASTQMREKDGMVMVYVPAGEFLRGFTDSDQYASSIEKPQRKITLDAFWIDKTEVTNAMYALCVEAGACKPPSSSMSSTRSAYYGNSEYANYPVIYVSWNDAQTYCDWAGARLPSEAEWEKAARGPDGHIYPWGDKSPDANLLNCSRIVGDTTEVGSYPNGASLYGALDMAGNVWEWVADWYDENYYTSSPAANPPGPASGQSRVQRGGSWINGTLYTRAANRSSTRPDVRDYNLGFRCVRSPLPSEAAPLPVSPSPSPLPPTETPTQPLDTATPTINATPTLGIGSTLTWEKDGMVMVYVPTGTFKMGSLNTYKDAYDNEKPQHEVFLDAFWIDKTEVTNAMYALCVKAGVCQPPSSIRSYTRSAYYGNTEFSNYPVIYVSWSDAQTYCNWVGARLPTEAEWEKAARGPDGCLYPWGDQPPDANLMNYNVNIGDTTEVGSYPKGASFYGALDMAGNVWERVADWYSETYYASSPAKNPQGPASGLNPVLRGGSWYNEARFTRVAFRGWNNPDYRFVNLGDVVGFRCVR